jgi:dephospho-CoA kinase
MKIGLTGGIGSGKTYVCNIIASKGFPVYNCDLMAKSLMVTDASIIKGIKELVGPNAYTTNGSINKDAISSYLFASKENAGKINAIVHPAVKKHFRNWALEQGSDVVFIESAILFESGFDEEVDFTVAVCAPMETRIQRAMTRDNATRQKIEERIQQQFPDSEIQSRADYLIHNDGAADLLSRIADLLTLIKKDCTN